ncbi:hypothetical protein Tco_0628948 [Tanacetum coccineum]|uniref:Uncharacterized protein n=1 Tax=Tanacetum coccineum TaxID=301880 RepID=A0ABQ4WRT2_9ASTR
MSHTMLLGPDVVLGANPIPHCLARGVHMDRAVWHEPEQFSLELNNISLEIYTIQRSKTICIRRSFTSLWQKPNLQACRISQVVLVEILENLAENDSIVAELGLSSEITQSPGGSFDTSEGSKNSRSFKDSGRSDEEYYEDGASSKEGGFETPQVRRSTRESKAPKAIIEEMVSLGKNKTWSLVRISAGKKASQRLWMFRVKEEHDGSKSWAGRKPRVQIEGNSVRTDSSTEAMVDDMLVTGSDMAELNKPKGKFPLVFEMKDRCSKKHVLNYVFTVGVTTVEWEILIFVEDSWNEEPCSDVHQVGDEREIEVLHSFNWPPRGLITEDGVLPERGYSQFNDVSSGYLVAQPQVNPDSMIAQGRHIVVLGLRGGLLGANPIPHRFAQGVHTDRAVWHDHAVWHEPEQFSSDLNNISLV